MNTPRTRIKVCGITRAEDAACCAELGVDALGFVFYEPSPRYLTPAAACKISRATPPFMTRVGLFVNAPRETVLAVLAEAPLHLLQFHGDEDEAYCASFGRPYLKAARIKPGLDLLEFAARFPSADAILCDAFVDGYGGAGKTFDWNLLPPAATIGRPLVLSGGLDAANVGAAIGRVRPLAVDVSSGVEAAKGIKDHLKIKAFVEKVREADETIRST
ncbi:MAG TPA: phosphoribosylanthranilate isomerase [Rhodocyclaceae bacterium]|nr:phosphoribosylanthranilate isomerase [Rhodocyclaceae bacterium]